MYESIECPCGYVGPSVEQGSFDVCPVCRSVVADSPEDDSPDEAVGRQNAAEPFSAVEESPLSSRKTLRIPCPNGHVNVTPAHMLGTQVVCPRCNAFYTLQMADSLEYHQIADREARKREEKEAKKWLNRAIFAAVFIVVSLIGMIVITLMGR
jgi:uncharacterized Zn finger protein (UPF0148 family)